MTPVLTLGPLSVTPFGLLVFAGAVCGVLLSVLRQKSIGPVLPFVVLGALLFGHMWWVFFCPPGYSAETGAGRLMLRIWEGGYTLYGSLFGGLVGAIAGTKLTGLDLRDTLDAMAPGACVTLIFSRIGEFFSVQGYGETVHEENLHCLPFSFITYEEEGYQEWRCAVWFWEALTALILLILLLVLAKKLRKGMKTALFFTGLGLSQILLEQMRRDDFVRLNPFVRFTQIAALLSLIAVLILFVNSRRPGSKLVIASFVEFTFASLTVVFAEFVFQKPQFTELLYVFSVLTVIGIIMLMRLYRARFSVPVSLAVLASNGALLGIYIADQWYDNTWLLYGFMAAALAAMGLTLFLNAPAENPS